MPTTLLFYFFLNSFLFFAAAINHAAEPWGMNCKRYEIRDITLPANVCFKNTSYVQSKIPRNLLILE